MEEVENQGIKQATAEEIATPETETNQQDTIETQDNQVEDRNDRNWRALRQSKEDLERKTRMQEDLIQRILSQQSHPQPVNQSIEEDIIQELAKEEYVPGEKVAKGFKKLKEEFRRELDEVKKTYASQHQNQLFNELKREYPDFEDVVNSETLNQLETSNPRLAKFIADSKDPYAIAVQSYEYIKAKGLASKEAPSKRARETEAKIEQNKKTVQTPMDKRPMAQAFSYDTLSEDQKKALQREMYSNAQRVGMGY